MAKLTQEMKDMIDAQLPYLATVTDGETLLPDIGPKRSLRVWDDETLIYNTRTGQVVYRLNDKEYTFRGYAMSKKYIRVFMHGYGQGIGHSLKLDRFELQMEPIS